MRLLTAFAALVFCGTAAVRAADIPPDIHRAYLKGATSVVLPSDPTTIPLEGTDWGGHYRSPYMKVFVNGHGPYTFLFDTGANVTMVSSKVLREASIGVVSAVPGHHQVAKAREIDVGGVRMRDYYVVVADGNDLDGILGFNSFANDSLTFDLKRRTLVVGSKVQPLPSAFWLPYSLRHHLPNIDLSIAGRKLPTLIDSGDDAYAWEGTSNDLRGLPFDGAPIEAGIVYNGQTGATSTLITAVDATLHVGPLYAQQPVVAINESLPLPDIGVDVIEQFVMQFDRKHNRVGFQPLFSGQQFVVPGELTCGVSISFVDPVRRVKSVLRESAASKAGMRAGDVVVAINGRPAENVTYRQWDELVRSRTPITIEWKRRARAQSRTFPVIELR